MCRTRWVEGHKAFEVFSHLFLPTVCCLEKKPLSSSSDWNSDTRSDSYSFLLTSSQFPFMRTLTTTQNVLAYTKGYTLRDQVTRLIC